MIMKSTFYLATQKNWRRVAFLKAPYLNKDKIIYLLAALVLFLFIINYMVVNFNPFIYFLQKI